MRDVRLDVKTGCVQRGRRIRDLAAELDEDYSRVSRWINGYQYPPQDFDRRVQAVFARWDAERRTVTAVGRGVAA